MSRNLIMLCLLFIGGCKSEDQKPVDIPLTPRDTTITYDNAFTLLTMDSGTVARYLDSLTLTDTTRLLISNFYNSRNYQYAWFNENQPTEHARLLWNLYLEYSSYAGSAPRADTLLHAHMDEWLTDTLAAISPSEALQSELSLTKLFFTYAFAKYIGQVNPAELQWYIPRKKIDVSALLDTLVFGEKNPAKDWEPLNPQYRLMKIKLLSYILIADKGGWDSLYLTGKPLRLEDKKHLVAQIKKRLQITGQFPKSDTSDLFTHEFKDSIISFQSQFGLQADGTVGQSTIDALNIPAERITQQILINMERVRWLPQRPDGTWIMANIPSFRLQVFEGDTSRLQMKIVVGTAATRTVIFSDDLKYIVFSPYWNVPSSIVRNEILPAMKKNKNYLDRSRMEQTGISNGLPVIRQRPGPGNALGNVKFLFPNNYNIYLHDTPAKSYFNESSRAFSHGCVRVSEPFTLAKFLLRHDTTWTDKAIRDAMNAGKEKWVTLKEPVPVFLTYFTSWVDENGRLQLRKDIYGHDERMKSHLFMQKDKIR